MPTELPTRALGGVVPTFTVFSPWASWNERQTLADGLGHRLVSYAGVYLLAHFADGPPLGPANYLDDAIVYVGMSRYLARRLGQFEGSVAKKTGHSGGHSYRDAHGALSPHLHVALLPVWFDKDTDPDGRLASFYTLLVESHVVCHLTAHRLAGHVPPLLNKP